MIQARISPEPQSSGTTMIQIHKEETKMKKNMICMMMAAVMAFGTLTGCGGSGSAGTTAAAGTTAEAAASESKAADAPAESAASSAGEKITVAIVQPMTHTSLDQIRETIIGKLSEDADIEVVTKNANGDTAALTTILQNLKSDKVDIVVPIATSTAQSAKAVYDGESTPIVFAAVSDPVAAGLTGEGSEMITGVSNNIPADEIVKLVYNFQPECQKIGFVYTSSETNSVSTINSAKKYCDENGIVYEETSISNVSELQTAVEALLDKGVEALYTGNDNTIASAMATYTAAAYPKQIPIYCGADSMVADGGFATVGVNYVQLGEQVAEIVKRIKAGEKPADIPYETLADYAKFVNMKAVKEFGGEYPESAYEGFEVLVEEDGTSHFNK